MFKVLCNFHCLLLTNSDINKLLFLIRTLTLYLCSGGTKFDVKEERTTSGQVSADLRSRLNVDVAKIFYIFLSSCPCAGA